MSVWPLLRRLPPAPKAGDPDFWPKHEAYVNERFRRAGCGLAVAGAALVVMVINMIIWAIINR